MPDLQFEGDWVRCRKVDLDKLLYLILQHVPFDEEWYLSQYPDVKSGVRAGTIASAADHYRRSGYLEGRLPFEPAVDESWYCNQYPDVKNAIRTGAVPDARKHYLTTGRFEGRLDRKSTRLNSSHANISYAVFCLKKKTINRNSLWDTYKTPW